VTLSTKGTDSNWLVDFSKEFPSSDIDYDCRRDLAKLAIAYLECLENGDTTPPESYLAACLPNCAEVADREQFLGALRSIQLLHMATGEFTTSNCNDFGTDAALQCPDLLGRTLGDYRLNREIGRGGMGIVFEAEQVSLGRKVAVKILPPLSNLDQRHIDRFIAESRAAAKLRHSHIVPVYGVGCVDSVYFYSMPLIESKKLAGPLSHRRVAVIASRVASALHHAHENGIVHRDIKPSNLLLDEQDKIWVADFGLARSHLTGSITASGAVVGTMRYMSPEQALGDTELVDRRTDIYALGVTMYELLVGRCPFDASERQVFLAELERGEPENLRKQDRTIPIDLETIVLKAIAREPSQRYRTAEQLANDLERFLSGEVISARRPSVGDCFGKWVRRNRALVVVGASAWAALSIITLFASIQLFDYSAKTQKALNSSRASLAEADAFYDSAREVVDHLAMRVSPKLDGIPGATNVRRELLRDTLRYYKSFMKRVAENPLRRRELATTQMTVAQIAEQLDAYQEAIQAYQQAIQILSGIPDSKFDEGLCWNNLGSLWEKAGHITWADRAYANATACLSSTEIRERPPEVARRFAVTLAARGNLLRKAGDNLLAADYLDDAAKVQRELIAKASIGTDLGIALRHDLLVTLGNRTICFGRADIDRAISVSENSVQLAREIAAHYSEGGCSGRFVALEDVMVAYSNRIALLLSNREISSAIELSIEQIDLCTDLCKFNLAEPDTLHELASAENRLGRLYAVSARTAEQKFAFTRALAILNRLVTDVPSNARYRASLATVNYNNAVLANTSGESDAYLKYLAAYQRELKWLQDNAPGLAAALATPPEHESAPNQNSHES